MSGTEMNRLFQFKPLTLLKTQQLSHSERKHCVHEDKQPVHIQHASSMHEINKELLYTIFASKYNIVKDIVFNIAIINLPDKISQPFNSELTQYDKNPIICYMVINDNNYPSATILKRIYNLMQKYTGYIFNEVQLPLVQNIIVNIIKLEVKIILDYRNQQCNLNIKNDNLNKKNAALLQVEQSQPAVIYGGSRKKSKKSLS